MKQDLIEDNMRMFLYTSLRNCKTKQHSYYNMLFNVFMFLLLLFIVILILYYARKHKRYKKYNDDEEQRIRERLIRVASEYEQQEITPFVDEFEKKHIPTIL